MVGQAGGAVEQFDTGGRTTGWIGLVAALGLAVVWLAQALTGGASLPVWVLTGSLLAAVLFWSAIIRPRVSASEEHLLLRNMLEDVAIPLAAVESHALRQVLAVRVGERRYVATGVGRTLRGAALGRGGGVTTGEPSRLDPGSGGSRPGVPTGSGAEAADFVEERISVLCADARRRAGIERWSPEQVALGERVRRTTTWPVVGALAVALAAFAGSIALG